jgi:NAD(P)-dependent dehydrogenase (short-subunit alcohol dehydrogenase family)
MENPMDMTGKRVLVTGASSGIGRETCVLLSRLGARVVLSGRNMENLEAALADMEPGEHVISPYDLAGVEGIPAWVRSLAKENGPFSGCVHSAGYFMGKAFALIKPQEVRDAFAVNFDAAFALAQGFRHKSARDPGPASIVFVTSVAGFVGSPTHTLYSATKGALISFSKSLALELARENIRVNCVAPALVKTPLMEAGFTRFTQEMQNKILGDHPLGLGMPMDVAHSAVFLLSDAATWITGTTLVVDGGYLAH